jgi:DNA-binding IclR family transcriptional regulator
MENTVPYSGTSSRPASPTKLRAEAGGTVEKAIDLLFFLHAGGGARGVSEIGRALGVPKSSAHRLLAALGRRGLVEQDEHGRYRPGIALLALGLGALEREPLAAAAHPILERESEATGETAFLTVARRGRIVVLDKREGAAFLRVAPTIGSEVPVHATAVGKLHLAFAPDSVSLPAEPWPAFTGQTPSARADLEREVAKAKKRGWATNRDEWIPGMAVVAAPVLLRDRMLGCMVIAAPSSRVDAANLAALASRVVKAAADIAARLEPDRRTETIDTNAGAGKTAPNTAAERPASKRKGA